MEGSYFVPASPRVSCHHVPHFWEVCRLVVHTATGGVLGPHYASSKAAIHGIMHWIARQYIKKGIVSVTSRACPPCLNYFIIEQTCNAVAPALIANTVMFSEPTVAHRVCGVLAFAF
jgi:NAD(P)-dependent dehydrogenase (short-subunit alcohol dehydrogenase family)